MNLAEEYNTISEDFWFFLQMQGEQGKRFADHYEKTYESGIFDTKTKRLMAMCAAIIMGCKGCILGQTQKAIEDGATSQEIMEACSVALSLGGTMAGSKISLIMQLLREKDMIQKEERS